jgi:hypothetical protein
MIKPFKIFIGYDPVERVSWHTAVSSILENSTIPISFIPINIRHFRDFFNRPRDAKQSNEFSFSRFLVPHLAGYEGKALFMDCDMLFRVDIRELVDQIADDSRAVHVVKHDYLPRDDIKYLDTVQYTYPRKNWSSFVVWNCSHPKNAILTPEFVESATGLELHRFTWLDDSDIGELDVRWNWLVGEYCAPPEDVKNVHWTVGGPYFNEYADCDFSDEWRSELERVNFVKQRS